ncbi:hypothetical protein VE00_10216 [Pseudogymnoascus sp. WSF 3629]|nr:hypothetical protein VE00_10216 [Pseudogymnoascus sp. WSF 3629]
MVTTARRRDPRDGRTLRIVDESFWSRERDMLSLRLSLLHDFLSAKGLTSDIQLHAEECRYLEYQIQSIHASLARTGDDTEARDALDHRLHSEPTSDRSERFKDWLANNQEFKTLMLSHQTEVARDVDGAEDGEGGAAVVVGGKYKCCELGCKHYVYGFETVEALRRHMGLHEDAEEARREDVVRRRTSGMSLEDGGPGGVGSREGSSEGERGVNGRKSSVVGNGNGFGVMPPSPFSKRTSLLPTPEAEGRRRGGGRLSLPGGAAGGLGGVRTAGPCLRCKVLKKKCDCQNPCKECPQQDVMAPDLWKALGCFHGPLTEMVRKCLHGFEQPSRPTTGTLAPTTIFWAAELDHLLTSHPAFASLDDDFWDSRHKLSSINSADIMDTTPDLTDAAYKRLLQEYGPAVGLLKTTVLDRAYLGRTAYNPFALLRVGRDAMGACNDPSSWHLYTLAQSLLITVLRYRLALASSPPTTPPSLTAPLTAFLLAFDTRFTNRKELPPSAWLAAFHSLCLFSITKTLLIDTPVPHQSSPHDAAARLATAHKILVSVFAWSAKLSAWCPKEPLELRDPLLRDWSRDASPAVQPPIRDSLVATQRLVNRDGWAKSCIRHTKDFLLGLGAGNVEGGFNGFLAMRYGGAESGYRGGDGFAPPAQRRRTDSGAVATDSPPVKSPLAEDVGPTTTTTTTSATPGRRAPLPPYPPQAASAAWRVASPPTSGKSEEEKERELASYYRRPLAVGSAGGEAGGFGGVTTVAPRMPLPSVAARMGSAEDGRGAAGGSPASSADKRPKRRELSKEQREHAAAVRRLGACGECKARKVKCSPSHHRGSPGVGGGRRSGSPGPTSPRTEGSSSSPGRGGGGGGSIGPIVRKRKSESPAPVMHMGMSMLARRASPDAADDDDGVGGEVLVVAVEE